MSVTIAGGVFEASHPKALAMYCSDGRFTRAVEELVRGLGHERLDTLTLPGGPGLLNLSTACYSDHDAAGRAMTFLVRGHAIADVVLVAHVGCGYYRSRLPMLEPAQLEARQREDLAHATRWIAERCGARTRAFFAGAIDGGIAFEAVEVAPAR